MGDACWRDTPLMAGQARRQMSLHAKWWGSRWSKEGTFQPACSLGYDLGHSPAGMRKERWQAGLIQGGANAGV